ncbi:MAG: undecaprenyl-diphosphate phosphatase [Clostridia bacterium]|nr:undecaprenyl-diphosphate phosphatase [Clostridia bacterium]
MSILQSILLGLVQGVTEFLPVSSSGHLLITRTLLGVSSEPLLFEIVVHLATLIAVFIVLWKDIKSLLHHPFGRGMRYLVVATIPAVVLTLLFDDFIESTFGGRFLGLGFIFTGVLLTLAEKLGSRRAGRKFSKMTATDAGVMGMMQAIAILPGVSRSGSTIVGGLFRGLDRSLCARFSFLMSIPAILGSLVFKFKDLITIGSQSANLWPLLFGALAAAVSGYLAIRFMLKLISNKPLYGFAIYVAVLGAAVLVCQFTGFLFPAMF